MSEAAALWALFGSAFLSATVLPLPSEGALVAYQNLFPTKIVFGVLVATIGNTLGGLTTYLIGRYSDRFLPKSGNFAPQILGALRRFGPLTLFFSWLPFFGDLLCGIAGWLKLSVWQCVLWMGVGKGLRYAVVAGIIFKLDGLAG